MNFIFFCQVIYFTFRWNCSGTTPNLLRAAQIKAGGGCSMECKNLSYRQKRSLASILSPNRIRLRTSNYRFPCCVFAKNLQSRSNLSRAQIQGIELLRIQLLPIQQDLTLHDKKWLNRSARLVKSRLFIVARAVEMSPARLQLQLFDQSFASPRRIEPRVYGVPSTPLLKTCPCLIFPQGLCPKP